jgi:integrase
MRWGELAGLRPEYVDLARAQLRVVETMTEVRGVMTPGPPKTPRSARRISRPSLPVEALSTAISGDGQEWVFVTEVGFPIRRHNFGRRVFKPTLVAAGISPQTRFHDLLHPSRRNPRHDARPNRGGSATLASRRLDRWLMRLVRELKPGRRAARYAASVARGWGSRSVQGDGGGC